jgi:hypothetical protein
MTAVTEHTRWARQFADWAGQHAFGVSTVKISAMTAHMLKHNSEVRAAAEAVNAAQAKVNETFGALHFTPTPADLVEALKTARKNYRVTRKAAADAVASL